MKCYLNCLNKYQKWLLIWTLLFLQFNVITILDLFVNYGFKFRRLLSVDNVCLLLAIPPSKDNLNGLERRRNTRSGCGRKRKIRIVEKMETNILWFVEHMFVCELFAKGCKKFIWKLTEQQLDQLYSMSLTSLQFGREHLNRTWHNIAYTECSVLFISSNPIEHAWDVLRKRIGSHEEQLHQPQ